MFQHQRRRKRRAGFSLMELMVVLVIIGLIGGTVALGVRNFLTKGYEARIKSDLKTIYNAAESYKLFNGGKYPDSIDQLTTAGESGEPFLDKVPTDPWNMPYKYEKISNSKVRVGCLGADGAPGGAEKDDTDYWWPEEKTTQ